MKNPTKLAIATFLLIGFFLSACSRVPVPQYQPKQVCGILCGIKEAVTSQCLEEKRDFWEILHASNDALGCVFACDENWNLYEDLDVECLANNFMSLEIDKEFCPVLLECL